MILKVCADFLFKTLDKIGKMCYTIYVRKRCECAESEEIKMKMNKYEKFSNDLKIALEKTEYIENDESIDDGGTCNLDTPAVFLNRWCEDKVKEAAEKAGSYAIKCDDLTRYFKKTLFTFTFGTRNQGYRRTARAEAICKVLSEMGYETYLYEQMD
jgi:hypothetical protein